MMQPAAMVLAVLLASLTVSPASALVIGMTPDPATAVGPLGLSFQVDYLGTTVGAIPGGGSLLEGFVGAGDDVIVLRFTNVGTGALSSVGASPSALGSFAIDGIGDVAGGVPTTGSLITPEDLASVATDGIAMGSFVDVFFALSGVEDGEQLTIYGYGDFAAAVDVSLLVPEPSVALLAALTALGWIALPRGP
jgi:hypothetical protein